MKKFYALLDRDDNIVQVKKTLSPIKRFISVRCWSDLKGYKIVEFDTSSGTKIYDVTSTRKENSSTYWGGTFTNSYVIPEKTTVESTSYIEEDLSKIA